MKTENNVNVVKRWEILRDVLQSTERCVDIQEVNAVLTAAMAFWGLVGQATIDYVQTTPPAMQTTPPATEQEQGCNKSIEEQWKCQRYGL